MVADRLPAGYSWVRSESGFNLYRGSGPIGTVRRADGTRAPHGGRGGWSAHSAAGPSSTGHATRQQAAEWLINEELAAYERETF